MLSITRRARPLTALLSFALAAILLPGSLYAQSSTIIEVLGADSLIGRQIGDVSFRELNGHVRIRQGNVRISCDRALQNLTRNSVDLEGNVEILQDTLLLRTTRGSYDGETRTARSAAGVYLNDGRTTLTAESGIYEANPRIARFARNVVVEEPDARIAAQSLVYERGEAKAVAWGQVYVSFPGERAIVTGDSVIHFIDRKYSIFPASPRLWQIDSTRVAGDSASAVRDSVRLDTVSIVADRMTAKRDSASAFIAEGGVELMRASLAARCARGIFQRSDSLVMLEKDPVLWYEENQLTGDSIAVFLADGRVRRLHVVGNAFSISRSRPTARDSVYPPGRFDQAKGQEMQIFFRGDDAERIRLDRTAISLYYLYDDRKLNGVRRESGDIILIEFDEGKLSELRTIGGAEGTYYPEKYVTGKESTYALDGFTWRADRPLRPPYPSPPSFLPARKP